MEGKVSLRVYVVSEIHRGMRGAWDLSNGAVEHNLRAKALVIWAARVLL